MSPLWEAEAAIVSQFAAKPPQTNEVRRAAALLIGFSWIAERYQGPLDILETGASAGLLLSWDKFQYDFGAGKWGDSDLVLSSEWRGGTPPRLTHPIEVRRRLGCDLSPVDLTDPDARLRNRSYVWPEETERLRIFDRAVAIAGTETAHVEKADALEWLERQLAVRQKGAATVVYQSVFSPYLSPDQRARLETMITEAGEGASEEASLAWLRFEPWPVGDSFEFFLDLRYWPGGETIRLARAHPHAAWVEPLA